MLADVGVGPQARRELHGLAVAAAEQRLDVLLEPDRLTSGAEQGLPGVAAGEVAPGGCAEGGPQGDQAGAPGQPSEQGQPAVPVTGAADPADQSRVARPGSGGREL